MTHETTPITPPEAPEPVGDQWLVAPEDAALVDALMPEPAPPVAGRVCVEAYVTCPACHGELGPCLIRDESGFELREPCWLCDMKGVVTQRRWVKPESAVSLLQQRSDIDRLDRVIRGEESL